MHEQTFDLEHETMLKMRQEHPDWIWNRSDTHVILGVPGCHEAFKSPVEPGNSFSPGVGTYGISTWMNVNGKLYAPEELTLEQLTWEFHDGHIPVLVTRWDAGGIQVKSSLFSDGDVKLSDIKDYLSVELTNPGQEETELSFFLVIRSFGAAGGPIRRLAWQENSLIVNDGAVLNAAEGPTRFGALSYSASKSDISVRLRDGRFPDQQDVVDESLWASGALEYRITLCGGEKRGFDFVAHLHANHSRLPWLSGPAKAWSHALVQADFVARWEHEFSIGLNLPDRRYTDAFFAQLAHLMMFTVADEPRISPVSYPIWWLRDGAYVVIALDRGGFHEFARNAVTKAAARDSFGGFGSEGDGPGQGIWILSEHYLLTGSLDYLRDVYPHIERKADLLRSMIHTNVPIKHDTEFRIPKMMLAPEGDVMCLPAKDGMIMGRMDHAYRAYWSSGFAYLGFRRAARCAIALGLDSSEYDRDADRLRESMVRNVSKLFGDERDINSAFWPTGWANRDDACLQNHYEKYWNSVRCPNGEYAREPLWTYFEAGQAHNYLLLGHRERALMAVEQFLATHTSPGLYTYSEGCDDENSALLWQRTRGWDKINYVTPHGWTAAELFLLLRDCLAREEGGKLILGSGIPLTWMDEPFSVENMPTHFGKLSFQYVPTTNTLSVTLERTPPGGIQADLPREVRLAIAPSGA